VAQEQVGGNVDAWCNRCGLMLAHTIEAMVSGTIKRVHCNTCQGQHVYRGHAPGEGATPKPKGRATTPKKSGGTLRASDYDSYLKGREANQTRRYSPRSTFAAGELIDHPKFGLGVATAVKDGGKLDILFPDGPRTLIHGR
jgi:hypothetical protein